MDVTFDTRTLSHVGEKIILTLLYYDIFNYPLTSGEIFRFLGTSHITVEDVKKELVTLRKKKHIYQFGNLFSVQNSEVNALRRLRGNVQAEKFIPVAHKKARLIARFPFVRAVMASGSLAKGYMDQTSDLDFFIVTEPGRLWIARTLLVFYKRIFLLNSHKHFCVNYFVDYDHLEIEEKNLFTATEIATVIPLYGAEYYTQLQEKNKWILAAFPNYSPLSIEAVKPSNPGFLKKMTESIINVLAAKRIDSFFKNLTLRRWTRVYRNDYPESDFQIAFKTKDYASKNHPRNYQRKVADLYAGKVNKFEARLESTWEYA